jgi:hypothetical protein
MTDRITIGRATEMYQEGLLKIAPPQYRGRSAVFMPIIDTKTGEPVNLNPQSFRVNGSFIPARQYLLEKDVILSDAQRFGLALIAWLKGYDGPDKWALAEDIIQFLGKPDENGLITLKIDVNNLDEPDAGANGTGE